MFWLQSTLKFTKCSCVGHIVHPSNNPMRSKLLFCLCRWQARCDPAIFTSHIVPQQFKVLNFGKCTTMPGKKLIPQSQYTPAKNQLISVSVCNWTLNLVMKRDISNTKLLLLHNESTLLLISLSLMKTGVIWRM